jgi:hypothetical protein
MCERKGRRSSRIYRLKSDKIKILKIIFLQPSLLRHVCYPRFREGDGYDHSMHVKMDGKDVISREASSKV